MVLKTFNDVTVEETPEPIVRLAWPLDGKLFLLEVQTGSGDVNEQGYKSVLPVNLLNNLAEWPRQY